jgi:hypothetical protein
MRGPTLLLVLIASAGCVSVDPVPPPGSTPWVRTQAQGHSRSLELLGVRLDDVEDNATSPSKLEFDFPFEWTARIDDMVVTCNQADRGEALSCVSGATGAFSMRVEADCTAGTIVLPDGSLTLEPWFDGPLFVGYLLRESNEVVAAIDTDHDWVFPVWFSESKRAHATVPAALALLSLKLRFPQHCGRLEKRRRFPRAN